MNSILKNDLIEKKIIKDAFDYEYLAFDESSISTYNAYKHFENEFSNRFDDYAKIFNVKNYCFYLRDCLSCNASASKIDSFNIMRVNIGYPIIMNSKFNEEYFSSIIMVALKNNKLISDAYAKLFKEQSFKFNTFMLECSIDFTFGHEFQHILQFNSPGIRENITFTENLNKDDFNHRKHVWEFDADRMASFHVLKSVFNKYLDLTNLNKNRDDYKLKCMLYIALSSIFITKALFYFGIMVDSEKPIKIEKQDFYTQKYSHPHPLTRMINILDYFYDCIRDMFPYLQMEQQELINNTMLIMNLYFERLCPGEKVIQHYLEDLGNYLEEINIYNAELYDAVVTDEVLINLMKRRGINFEKS